MSRTEYIYVLKDSTKRIFYVGRSVDPSTRLQQHLDESAGGGSSKKCAHIRHLLDLGEEITIHTIDEALADKIAELEAWWIERLDMSWHDDGHLIVLRNGNSGSQGNSIDEVKLRTDIQQWKKTPKPKVAKVELFPCPPGPHADKNYAWWESHPEQAATENKRRADWEVTRKYLLRERKKDEKRKPTVHAAWNGLVRLKRSVH